MYYINRMVLACLLLIYTSQISAQRNKIYISEDSVIKKWVQATINVECTQYPSTDLIRWIRRAYKEGRIDSLRVSTLSDTVQNNLKKASGTAIFLSYRNQHFLISARHVFACEGSDSMRLAQAIVLVEDSTAPKNNSSGSLTIDTILSSGVVNSDNPQITITVAPGNTLPNFRYEDNTAEIRYLTWVDNTNGKRVYYFSSVAEDIGIINLDTIGIEGKKFVKTLTKRGYMPIEIADIDLESNFKRLDSVICIGFPRESSYAPKRLTWFRGLFEADFRSFHMVSKGTVENNIKGRVDFEANIFTYHGFSGGPLIKGNKLIGLVNGATFESKSDNTSALSYLQIFHPRFIKASLLLKGLRALTE